MAAASMCNCMLRLQATPAPPPYLHYRNGDPKGKNEQLPCQSRMYRNGKTKLKAAPVFVGEEEEKNKSRRLMLQILFSAIPLASAVDHSMAEPSSQGAEQYQLFTDDTDKFSISIPPDWLVGQGEADASRTIVAFFPKGNTSSSVSVLITGLSPDFTRLESFGNVDAFAENLIGSLDRSWQRPPGVAAKLLDSKAKNGFYYIEYSLQNPGESLKHIYTALGISSNGWYNRLYTVTGQFFEEDSEKYGSTIQKSVSSFRFI
ncbi:psbP domain-containing protein 3, chloroplastic [Nymphaea colorata]|uniref:psbP domain-containing protein 3, chloroplastic n=1 Tax=Nymphaea colorata TaxID=210225 RepID=UPI00129E2A41|nr:psbP domain-containing protein 3, chloroplastic [Nymphaea colorata]